MTKKLLKGKHKSHQLCGLKIVIQNGYVIKIDLTNSAKKTVIESDHLPVSHKLAQQCVKEFTEYFAHKRQKFSLPFHFIGTAFQKKVWQELYKIPFGQVLSYGAIAKKIKNPKASRAVGGSCNKNPLPLLIPCHRVIGTNGHLTGFAGGLNLKAKLLHHEKGVHPGL